MSLLDSAILRLSVPHPHQPHRQETFLHLKFNFEFKFSQIQGLLGNILISIENLRRCCCLSHPISALYVFVCISMCICVYLCARSHACLCASIRLCHRGWAAPDPPSHHHHHPRLFVLRVGSRREETVVRAGLTEKVPPGTRIAGEAGERRRAEQEEKPQPAEGLLVFNQRWVRTQ